LQKDTALSQCRQPPPNAANILLMLQLLLCNCHAELCNEDIGVTRTSLRKKVSECPPKLAEFDSLHSTSRFAAPSIVL
jgi:hypothetical protein